MDDKEEGEKGRAESTNAGLSHTEIIMLMSQIVVQADFWS